MADHPIYRGFDLFGRAQRWLKQKIFDTERRLEAGDIQRMLVATDQRLHIHGLRTPEDRLDLAVVLTSQVLKQFVAADVNEMALPCYEPVCDSIHFLLEAEKLFAIPTLKDGTEKAPPRSALWEAEDELRRIGKLLENLEQTKTILVDVFAAAVEPLVLRCPALVTPLCSEQTDDIVFETNLMHLLPDVTEIVEAMVQLPFAPEVTDLGLLNGLSARIEFNLVTAAGRLPSSQPDRPLRPPPKSAGLSDEKLVQVVLQNTPFALLFDVLVPIRIPQATRFEHQHIVAGSGHGKTQTLQHFVLHDLDAVAAGRTSIVVIDSQSDLINTISGLDVFAPGGSLADRLCLIDPTDVGWPVALNLFDVGLERVNQYSQLDRKRLINSVLELYDFVLGSLLDAGMTQKQTVIFRYITRLLLHIPDATIHTFRRLLEYGGLADFRPSIDKLEGSARAFFETEYESREFTQTRKQVLRRLYGILENQTFERMFSHPRSKVDLYSEMNAGKVILINTAKDLLKENGSEIFGRFFIAMLAQAAQERAVLPAERRMPTFVYVDEASDYFDRTIGVILSQARKYNVGISLSHQFLGQLDTKLQEAVFANTAIKFAGGVSAKDSRALAGELRTDASFIEGQEKLSFAAYIKGTTRHAVPIAIGPGQMENRPRMSAAQQVALKQNMRAKYAVHYSEARAHSAQTHAEKRANGDGGSSDVPPDSGEPMPWE